MANQSVPVIGAASKRLVDFGDGTYGEKIATLPLGADGASPASAANPVQVATPTPGALVAGQQAVTASAVPLPSLALKNGIVVKAKSGNAGKVFVGASDVNTTDTGAGKGYGLSGGESVTISVSNANVVYIIGTAADVVYFLGN